MLFKLAPGQVVLVTVLGSPNASFQAHLLSCGGRQLCFTADSRVAIGTAVRLDIGDDLVLGEIQSVQEAKHYVLVRHVVRAEDLARFQGLWT